MNITKFGRWPPFLELIFNGNGLGGCEWDMLAWDVSQQGPATIRYGE